MVSSPSYPLLQLLRRFLDYKLQKGDKLFWIQFAVFNKSKVPTLVTQLHVAKACPQPTSPSHAG